MRRLLIPIIAAAALLGGAAIPDTASARPCKTGFQFGTAKYKIKVTQMSCGKGRSLAVKTMRGQDEHEDHCWVAESGSNGSCSYEDWKIKPQKWVTRQVFWYRVRDRG